MARAAEGVGCGNEIEDSTKKWICKNPLMATYIILLLANDVKKGFEVTLEKSNLYLRDARLAHRITSRWIFS